MKIYVVISDQGEYEMQDVYPVEAFYMIEEAVAYCRAQMDAEVSKETAFYNNEYRYREYTTLEKYLEYNVFGKMDYYAVELELHDRIETGYP